MRPSTLSRPNRRAIARFLGVVAIPVLMLSLSSCGGSSDASCTAVGCTTGAQVDLSALPLQPGPKSSVTICVDSHCSTTRSPGSSALVDAGAEAPYNNERIVTVTITMTGPSGAVIAHSNVRAQLSRYQPNGANCPPTCFIARLRLTATGKLETA